MYEKSAENFLEKLTPGVNFTNNLRAIFAPIFQCQKRTNPICKYKKLRYNRVGHKMLVKLTLGVRIRSSHLHPFFTHKNLRRGKNWLLEITTRFATVAARPSWPILFYAPKSQTVLQIITSYNYDKQNFKRDKKIHLCLTFMPK